MKNMFAYLWQYRYRVGGGLLALLFVDLGQLLIPQILRFAVDEIVEGKTGGLVGYGFMILGIGVVICLLRYVWRLGLLGAARKVRRDVRTRLYDRLLRYTNSFFEDHQTGDLMAHFTNDTSAVMRATGLGVLALADFCFMTVLSLFFMISIDPWLTLLALLPFSVLAVFAYVMGRIIHRRFQSVQNSFSTLSDRVEEAVTGIRVLKSFTRESAMENHFDDVNNRYLKKNMSLVTWQGLLRPGILFLSGLSALILLYVGGTSVIRNDISLGDFAAFVQYLTMLSWPMLALGMGINLVQRGAASMERIQSLLDVRPAFGNADDAVAYRGPGEISVRTLSFSYNEEEPVLRNVSFDLADGASLGVVGPTGSGKSTLLSLINRVYDPPPDTIFLDDRDLRTYSINSLRERISLVPQNGFMFSSSIRENIAFGRPDASLDEVKEVAQRAGVHEEIMAMSDGYDTSAGERGVSVSGGQKQRIAIARALLLDPDILMLDDALSSVDARKEEEILNNLSVELQNRTSIVVTHRVSAVADFDRVMTLDNGRVTAFDDPETLRRRDGYVARMLELQRIQREVQS